MKYKLHAVLAISAFLASGCEDRAKPSPEPIEQVEALQVTGELQFFCNWNNYDDAYLTAKSDYEGGNIRLLDAWTVLDKKDVPHSDPKQQSMCWEGALLYIGVFGSRAELPKLLAFAEKDWVIDAETTNVAQAGGISDLGEQRADVNRVVYLALAAQIRRQLLFDGLLDSSGVQAAALLEDCANDHMKCLTSTPMHIYRKQRHQRHAVRGLAISGSSSNWIAFQAIESQLASLHFLLPYALVEGKRMRNGIQQNLSLLVSGVPAP